MGEGASFSTFGGLFHLGDDMKKEKKDCWVEGAADLDQLSAIKPDAQNITRAIKQELTGAAAPRASAKRHAVKLVTAKTFTVGGWKGVWEFQQWLVLISCDLQRFLFEAEQAVRNRE